MTAQKPYTRTPESGGRCPVLPYVFTGPTDVEALTYFRQMDDFRADARPFFRTEDAQGYWVFTDGDAVLQGLQSVEVFSSSAMEPHVPDPPYRWIPLMLDPPEHSDWRRLLAGWFSPGRVKAMADEQRRLAAQLIDPIIARGECDFVGDFAKIFPTTIFLQIMGMPVDLLPQFLDWKDAILDGNDSDDWMQEQRIPAMMAVAQYFTELINARRAGDGGDQQDLVSDAVTWQIDGHPIDDASLLSCFLLLFLAGLDTVTAQASYAMYDLALHPATRQRIVTDSSVIPKFVEEVLRIYPIVQMARKVTADTEFHGCPLKAGDMALFPLSVVGRDEEKFQNAADVDLDRGVTRHLAFGAGPHRCLGSHLARQEMVILLEEWHKRVPDYEVASTPTEHSGGVHGLNELRLRWTR
jgi:cytochrome P450